MSGRTWSVFFGIVLVGVVSARPAAAQESSNGDLRKEMQALSDAVKAMQQDLRDIKALLQQRGAPPAPQQNVVLELGNHPFRGKADATLTMVAFSDFQCPFCARHVSQTDPLLIKEYVDTGKLKVLFVDFPLESIHPFAFKAAETARCAGEQGKFWDMHDQLFRTQRTPAEFSNWTAQANAVGLKTDDFEGCLSSANMPPTSARTSRSGEAPG